MGVVILLLIGFGIVYFFSNNETLPEGKKGIEADGLAIKMFNAINYDAFENAEVLEWNFRNAHFYKWYKQKNIVEVSWDENKVILNTKDNSKSEVSLSFASIGVSVIGDSFSLMLVSVS